MLVKEERDCDDDLRGLHMLAMIPFFFVKEVLRSDPIDRLRPRCDFGSTFIKNSICSSSSCSCPTRNS